MREIEVTVIISVPNDTRDETVGDLVENVIKSLVAIEDWDLVDFTLIPYT